MGIFTLAQLAVSGLQSVNGCAELLRHPVPYGGIEVQTDMAAQHFYVVHVVIITGLQGGAPVHDAIGFGINRGGRHRRWQAQAGVRAPVLCVPRLRPWPQPEAV